jgi:hypothetical protein
MIVDDEPARVATHRWLTRLVVGLNLCPFASAPLREETIRIAVSDATQAETLVSDLVEEVLRLHGTAPGVISTTLLVVPQALQTFDDFNAFLGVAEDTLRVLDLEGELQLASFHPDYRFAGSMPGEPGNYSNRSPYPVLHLLREIEVSQAVERHPDPARIYRDNIRRLEALGVARLGAMLADCHGPPDDNPDPGLE